MTYQEYFEQLQQDFAEKADKFIKLETELSKINGFGDWKEMQDYLKAKSDWQLASNTYWGFLTFVRDNKINPKDSIK